MMRQIVFLFAVILSGAGISSAQPAPVCVVELFTSEGCSSCPAADKLVSKLLEEKPASSNTICLSWHVDYWNNLGWTDRFSSAENSARQKKVCEELGENNPYTPQMVINGRVHFVGSDEKLATKSIAEALKTPATVEVTSLGVFASSEPGVLSVSWAMTPAKGDLDIILTEDSLSTKVGGGENSGVTLHHDAVVRSVVTQKISDDGKGKIKISVPKDVVPKNAHIALIARRPGSTQVMGGSVSVPIESVIPSVSQAKSSEEVLPPAHSPVHP